VLLWSRPLLTPRHHHCEGRPPALQTYRAGFCPLHHLFGPECEHPTSRCTGLREERFPSTLSRNHRIAPKANFARLRSQSRKRHFASVSHVVLDIPSPVFARRPTTARQACSNRQIPPPPSPQRAREHYGSIPPRYLQSEGACLRAVWRSCAANQPSAWLASP